MEKSEESHKAESPWYFVTEGGAHNAVYLWQDGAASPSRSITPEAVTELEDDLAVYRSLLAEVRRAIDAGHLFPSNKEPGREAVQGLIAKIRTAV